MECCEALRLIKGDSEKKLGCSIKEAILESRAQRILDMTYQGYMQQLVLVTSPDENSGGQRRY
jgi:hypothetical protein